MASAFAKRIGKCEAGLDGRAVDDTRRWYAIASGCFSKGRPCAVSCLHAGVAVDEVAVVRAVAVAAVVVTEGFGEVGEPEWVESDELEAAEEAAASPVFDAVLVWFFGDGMSMRRGASETQR
ncbi:hypothetical protein HK101_005468 [Irineochytrium annulatum]|nr:hypothetical protein HK101_005468 [Irineochytrium annulatum]